MAYTASDATKTLFNYLNINEEKIQFIENTKKRGFILKYNDEDIVIFVYPISSKIDGTKNFFDTRDSGPTERKNTWLYATTHNMKYFCLAVNDRVEKYKNYIFSLECPEKTISNISEKTQIVIPNDYIPSKNFDRFTTQLNIFLSSINKNSIYNYLTHFDSRPYYSNSETVASIDTQFHGGENKIFYGVPGSGKSYYIEQHYSVNENNSMRVVFHPDYTYSDFVGQILPKIVKGENGSEDKLKYEFIPGPFTKILKKANDNPEQQFYLIIEELNRGNAPAIFGEIFQLLDRNESGESKYSITNAEIADIVFENTETPIKIPANLSILATMNTSDQNVFTMDTAFQRRWIMVHIPNKFESPQADCLIVDTQITWKAFAKTINDKLAKMSGELTSTEDKSLGAYFARKEDFEDRSRFAEKVLKYLWDDAFKMERPAIFKASFNTLSSVIETFEDTKIENPLNEVLDDNIYAKMKEASTMQEQVQSVEE